MHASVMALQSLRYSASLEKGSPLLGLLGAYVRGSLGMHSPVGLAVGQGALSLLEGSVQSLTHEYPHASVLCGDHRVDRAVSDPIWA